MRVIVQEQSVSNSCSCLLEVLPVCVKGISVEGNLFSLAARFVFFFFQSYFYVVALTFFAVRLNKIELELHQIDSK